MAQRGRHVAKTAPQKKLWMGIVAALLVVAAGAALFFVIRSVTRKPGVPDVPDTPDTPVLNLYTVTLLSDGKAFSTADVEENSSYTLPHPPQSDETHLFQGWRDRDGSIYQPGSPLIITGNTTLTALWEEVAPPVTQVKVTLSSEERTLSETTLDENSPYALPEGPEREGYRFLGWQDAAGETHAPGEEVFLTADAAFTALWEEIVPEYTGPRNPLTGLPAAAELSGKRPWAVMLNNIRVATPQAGISRVDLLFEAPVEGGITRFMGVYQDLTDVGTIGSVRSARPYYIDLAQGLDAVYIHAGGSPEAYTILSNRKVTHIDGVLGSGETFFRDSWRKANMGSEHSLMLDPSLIPTYVEKHNVNTDHASGYQTGLQFADEPDSGSASAQEITFTFLGGKTTGLLYEEETGLYALSQYGGKLTDSTDGSQVRVKNAIAIYTSVSQIPGDEAGRLKITINGSGSGYFACNGTYTLISWKKDSATSPFTFTLQDGTPLTLGRGSTYIAILPLSVKNAASFK